jgi:hypothetical protein
MDRKGLAILLLAAVVLYLLLSPGRSGFLSGANLGNSVTGSMHIGARHAVNPADFSGSTVDSASPASLIPREVVQTEDYGQYKPSDILSGQNFLDPRSQVGYPETLGGVLRNGNRQIRSEPLNPRVPVSIFNLSTIPPDVMRPKFEISPEYQ